MTGDVRVEYSKFSYTSSFDEETQNNFVEHLKTTPIPKEELLNNLFLFMPRRFLTHLLYLDDIYKRILNVHGVIMEFGVRWGRNLAIFHSLRGIHEPYNYNRKIIGFDTFEGFPNVNEKDGKHVKNGFFNVTENYDILLNEILDLHQNMSPLSHIKKFDLIKGNASFEVPKYLEDNPETVISLAYFDLDIYQPTKDCLNAIKPHLTKGSIICFDELNDSNHPGETEALKEVFGIERLKIQRTPISGIKSFIIID